jgi:sec-independent protein translocase protein TatB
MFGLGFSEILILAAMALILIGPKELPAIATAIGRFLNELKRSSDDFTREIKTQAKVDLPSMKSELNQTLRSPTESLKNALSDDHKKDLSKDLKDGLDRNSLTSETLNSSPSVADGHKESTHGGPV